MTKRQTMSSNIPTWKELEFYDDQGDRVEPGSRRYWKIIDDYYDRGALPTGFFVAPPFGKTLKVVDFSGYVAAYEKK